MEIDKELCDVFCHIFLQLHDHTATLLNIFPCKYSWKNFSTCKIVKKKMRTCFECTLKTWLKLKAKAWLVEEKPVDRY